MMKLKQKTALSLAIFYMVSVMGVALSLHFCGGKLSNVKWFSNEVSCKFCKDIPLAKIKDDGCCKNTKVEVKVKDSHETVVKVEMPKLFAIPLFLNSPLTALFKRFDTNFLNKITNKAPPKSARLALHVFNCIFRN